MRRSQNVHTVACLMGACHIWQVVLTPKLIESLRGVHVCAVAVGSDHSLVLDEAGLCYSFGLAERGQLGLGDRSDQVSPRPIESLRGLRISTIAAGPSNSLAINSDGAIHGWGSPHTLGLGVEEDQLTPMAYPQWLRIGVH